MEPLRKSYKGFVWWLVIYVAVVLVLPFLPLGDETVFSRMLLLFTVWGMAGLAYIVYRTESVYWYNGTTYEDAVAAGSDRRRAFAMAHLKCFTLCALLVSALCLLCYILSWPFWVDMTLGFLGLIVAALYTMKFKL